MLPLVWVVLLFVAGAGVLVFQGIAVVLAYGMPRLPSGTPTGRTEWPTVTAVIAARNEETDLGACLDSLLAQRYPGLEIIVVDGGSTDGTRAIVQARAPRVRLLEEPPLPPGWIGKSWACDQGARASQSDWILFTDADVRYAPEAVAETVAWAVQEGADLATLAPRMEMIGWWERVVLPLMVQLVLLYFRTPRVNRPGSRAAMANGQYLLVRRSAYEATGGHAAVRGAVLEDVRIAQEFRRAGKVLRVAFAPELISTRMYRDRHEMFEGLLKNIHGTEFSALRQVAFLAALVGFYWVPLLLLPFGLLTGSFPLALLGVVLWAALFVKHAEFAHAVGGRRRDGLLYPIAIGFYLALVLTSLVRGIRRQPIAWKGRQYPLDG